MALKQYIVGGKEMLHNLMAEISRGGIKRKQLADAIEVSDKALQNKIYGRTDFTLPEAVKIRDSFFPGMDLQYLFEKEQ